MCRRCAVAQIVREQHAEMIELHKKICDLEHQLQSIGVRPCTKENEAIYVPIDFSQKKHPTSKF